MQEIQPPEFKPFPKIARLFRQVWITEKIDGTNAVIHITPEGGFFTGSRNRWITPQQDNYGFSQWAHQHKDELMALGPGWHHGEWWGVGINRAYGLSERRWSLFNTIKWCPHDAEPQEIPTQDPRVKKAQTRCPACCHVVPVVMALPEFNTEDVDDALYALKSGGSLAAPGFMRPEGIVAYHVAGNIAFKATLENDGEPKSRVGN